MNPNSENGEVHSARDETMAKVDIGKHEEVEPKLPKVQG